MISYFGCIIPDDVVNIWKGTSEAANKFQKRLISAFREEIQDIYSIVSCDYYKNIVFVEDIGNVNLLKKPKHILKHFYIFIQYFKNVIKSAKNKNLIIQFNPEYYSIFTPFVAKMFKVDSILILSDFTESNEQKNIIKKLFAILHYIVINNYSRIITLSDTRLIKKCSKVLTYRGSINSIDYKDFKRSIRTNKIIVLYSGLFDEITGVHKLLEAFSQINQDTIELHFSGWGPLEELINEYSGKDKRIINHSFMVRKDFIELMKQAHITINPRDMNYTQNKNNFPSKILEYLASGRIVISTYFSGYKEFKDFEILFIESGVVDIKNAIIKAIRDYEYLSKMSFNVNRFKITKYYLHNQKKRLKDFVTK